MAFQEQGVAGRSHRRGFAEVQRVDREPGKPCDLAPKRSNADEAVVAQLLQLDAPRDLKIEFEMSIARAAGGFVHPERRRPATQTCEAVARSACARIILSTKPPPSVWATETIVVQMAAGQMVAQPV